MYTDGGTVGGEIGNVYRWRNCWRSDRECIQMKELLEVR